jgi:hypothetical protein
MASIDKNYVFIAPGAKVGLLDLFERRKPTSHSQGRHSFRVSGTTAASCESTTRTIVVARFRSSCNWTKENPQA